MCWIWLCLCLLQYMQNQKRGFPGSPSPTNRKLRLCELQGYNARYTIHIQRKSSVVSLHGVKTQALSVTGSGKIAKACFVMHCSTTMVWIQFILKWARWILSILWCIRLRGLEATIAHFEQEVPHMTEIAQEGWKCRQLFPWRNVLHSSAPYVPTLFHRRAFQHLTAIWHLISLSQLWTWLKLSKLGKLWDLREFVLTARSGPA